MTELISKQMVLDALGCFNDKEHGDEHFLNGIETAKEIVENMPSTTTGELVAKILEAINGEIVDEVAFGYHGSWVGIDDYPHETWECNRCGHIWHGDEPPKYCEMCGARMDGNETD